MLLTIDVGNTNMVFGLLDGERLVGSFRAVTNAPRTADELGLTLCVFFQRLGVETGQVEDTIISSVVPGVMTLLKTAVTKYFGKPPIVVDEDVAAGIQYPEGTPAAGKLGTDRAVACAAAIEKYGTPLIVVDFGTATTLDALDEEGVYRGGCILAGMRIFADSLTERTALLPRIELERPDHFLGRNTVSQIQVGSVWGYIGAAEYLIRKSRQELGCGEDVKVVATGGLAHRVAAGTDVIDVLEEDLILDGLRIIYERMKGKRDQ